LKPSDMAIRIKKILDLEKVESTDDGIRLLIDKASGDMRTVINAAQMVGMICNSIDETSVKEYTSLSCADYVMDLLSSNDFKDSFLKLKEYIVLNGIGLTDIITDIKKKILCDMMEGFSNGDKGDARLIYIMAHIDSICKGKGMDKNFDIQIGRLVGLFREV